MSRPWVLVFTPPAGPVARRVGGLSLPLRLALDAARAGASAVVVTAESGVPLGLLEDPRLRLPLLTEPPPDARQIRVTASLLLHQGAWRTIASGNGDAEITVATAPRVSTPHGFDAIDVTDDEIARVAERRLFQSLRKPADGWTSRLLNRHLSLALSRLLVRTPLTPNQVSVGILGVGLLGAWLAAQGSYGSLLAGATLFQMQSVLDGCDGEMSRVTHRGSLLGEWLDTVGDDVTNYGFFAGAALGLHASTGSELYLAAGGLTVGAGVTASLIEYRYLWKIGSGDLLKYPTSRTASEGTGPIAAIAPIFKRDTFVLLTLVAAALDLMGPLLVVFSLAAVGILATVLSAEARMARDRRV